MLMSVCVCIVNLLKVEKYVKVVMEYVRSTVYTAHVSAVRVCEGSQ